MTITKPGIITVGSSLDELHRAHNNIEDSRELLNVVEANRRKGMFWELFYNPSQKISYKKMFTLEQGEKMLKRRVEDGQFALGLVKDAKFSKEAAEAKAQLAEIAERGKKAFAKKEPAVKTEPLQPEASAQAS